MLQSAATDRRQMFHTAHQFSSREGFTKRLHSPRTVKAFSFCCHCGTATREEEDSTVFFPHVVLRPKEEQGRRLWLKTILSNEYKLKHKNKMFSSTDQCCGVYCNREEVHHEQPFTSRCCSHVLCQSMRQKALTRNTVCQNVSSRRSMLLWRFWRIEVELSPEETLCMRATPPQFWQSEQLAMPILLRPHSLKQAVSKLSSTVQEI